MIDPSPAEPGTKNSPPATVRQDACPTCGAVAKRCRTCGRQFAANASRASHIYCSRACGTAARVAKRRASRPDRTCRSCGTLFTRPAGRGRPPFHCLKCRTTKGTS